MEWIEVADLGKGKTFCETDDEISSSVNKELFGTNRIVVARPTTLCSGVTW